MLVRSHAFAIQRGNAEHVLVELDVRAGLPAFSVIGLAPGAARDARERVQAAVINSGLTFPRRRVTINLAPASSRRNGPEFDLAIAVCVVAADGALDAEPLARVGLFGELGLGGLLRPCSSPGAAAVAAGEAGLAALIVSWADADEARAAGALPVAGVRDLAEAIALLAARRIEPPARGRARVPGGRASDPRHDRAARASGAAASAGHSRDDGGRGRAASEPATVDAGATAEAGMRKPGGAQAGGPNARMDDAPAADRRARPRSGGGASRARPP